MDLMRLYNLTTPQLRAEAQELGVSDTEALSRAQLIQAIKVRVGATPPDGFLSRVWGFAKWALQTTANPDQVTQEMPPRAADPPTPPPAAAPTPAAASTSGGVTAHSASSGPPRGVFSSPGGSASYDEPFPTRTMARILAEQGHYKRALAIYATLLRDQPADAELRQEAEEVRSRSRARRAEAR